MPYLASLFAKMHMFPFHFLSYFLLSLSLKEHLEDFPVLGQFCAKIVTLRLKS